jgi:hypothetical protein
MFAFAKTMYRLSLEKEGADTDSWMPAVHSGSERFVKRSKSVDSTNARPGSAVGRPGRVLGVGGGVAMASRPGGVTTGGVIGSVEFDEPLQAAVVNKTAVRARMMSGGPFMSSS